MSSTGPSAIDTRILNRVVMLMSADFATKDVSEHADMLAAHPAMREAKLWHAWVGSALSKERTALGIDETIKGTTRGSRWARTCRCSCRRSRSQAVGSSFLGIPILVMGGIVHREIGNLDSYHRARTIGRRPVWQFPGKSRSDWHYSRRY